MSSVSEIDIVLTLWFIIMASLLLTVIYYNCSRIFHNVIFSTNELWAEGKAMSLVLYGYKIVFIK